jgi:hypothetical protein
MDLRAYYRKIREVEGQLSADEVVVVSHETADGGVAGVKTEVPRRLAAKLLVEGKARLATEEEAEEYRKELKEAHRKAQEVAAASKVQIAVISENELRTYRSLKTQKQ